MCAWEESPKSRSARRYRTLPRLAAGTNRVRDVRTLRCDEFPAMNRSLNGYVDEGERTNCLRRFVKITEGVAQLLYQSARSPARIVVETVRHHALLQFGDIVENLDYRVGVTSVH